MRLSFVIPCYNEESNIVPFFSEIMRVFANREWELELVFVDDGSTDRTWAAIQGLRKDHQESLIQGVSFSRNFGKESALYAGLEAATGDRVCLIDADLQQRPEVVLEMLKVMDAGEECDCVAACQRIRRESASQSFFKKHFYQFITLLSGLDFVNGASDFRLMKRKMVNALLSMPETNRFSKGLFSWVGFKTKYISYEAAERFSGETKWNFRKLLRYALDGIISFSTVPLKLSTYIGLLALLFSFLYFLALLIKKLVIGIAVSGYPTIVTMILFFGGAQLFCVGLLGEYLAKVFAEVKRRPIYIARNRFSWQQNLTKEEKRVYSSDEQDSRILSAG